MAIKGIDNLEMGLRKYNGGDAVISISHKLYGSQKIKCKFDCIVDEQRIGFRVKSGQEIYIYKEDIKSFDVNDVIFFEDDIMGVEIKI